MSRLDESMSVMHWAQLWSLIVAIISCACALTLNIRLKNIKKTDWTITACASGALVLCVASIIAAIWFLVRNKKTTKNFLDEFEKKHGVPLSLSLPSIQTVYSKWSKWETAATGVGWGAGCFWSLVLVYIQNDDDVTMFDRWFGYVAHLANLAAAAAFTVIFLYTADCTRIIGRGTTPEPSPAALPDSSPQNATQRRGSQEEIKLQPRDRRAARRAARPSETVREQPRQEEAEVREETADATNARNA